VPVWLCGWPGPLTGINRNFRKFLIRPPTTVPVQRWLRTPHQHHTELAPRRNVAALGHQLSQRRKFAEMVR
jgi:hypothetical protein